MTREATLIESHFCAPHTRHFQFRVEGPAPFQFQPGQYITLVGRFDGQEMQRPYSIASPPRGDNSLDLCLNLIEKGQFSKFLFEMKPGQQLWVKGPDGSFLLRPEPRDTLFVATGTGISPIRAMIHYLFGRGTSRQITLLFGVRYEESILYRQEFEQLAAQHPNFKFVVTLSRLGEHWPGATGYVQEHVLSLLGGRTDVDVYACGLKTMVNEVRGLLLKNGFDERSIFYEKYD